MGRNRFPPASREYAIASRRGGGISVQLSTCLSRNRCTLSACASRYFLLGSTSSASSSGRKGPFTQSPFSFSRISTCCSARSNCWPHRRARRMPSSKRRMDSSREVSPLSSRSTTRSNRSIASSKESASRSSCFFSMGSLIGQCLPSPHLTINSPVGKPYPDQVSGLHLRDGLDQSVFPVAVYERISPAHHFERTETVQLSDPVFPKGAAASQKMDHPRRARPLQPPQPLPEGGDPLRRAAGCQAGN